MPIDARTAEPTDPLPGDLTVIPAMFEHAKLVYNTMLETAKLDPENNLPTYEGHLTNLFKGLRLSVPYYTTIKNMLVQMGCIEQTRRGGGNGTSKWVLWKPPELETWKAAEFKNPRHGNKQTRTEQMVKDLTTRMRELENVIMKQQDQLNALKEWTKFNV